MWAPGRQNLTIYPFQILWRVIALWKKLSHENVIPFYGAVTLHPDSVTFAYAWAENLNIQLYLDANPGAPRPDLVMIDLHSGDKWLTAVLAPQLFQVTKGLQFLHSVDIIHGTPKPVSRRFHPPNLPPDN